MFSEWMQRKNKCDICTGCGRCADTSKETDVILGMPLLEKEETGTDRRIDGMLIAVDIGTTTVAMQLHDETGRIVDHFAVLNPQIEYGADVLSRIQAAAEPEAACKMRHDILRVLRQGVEHFCKGASPNRLHMVIAANTTMVYLLMGWDTTELGMAPFYVSHTEAVEWLFDDEIPTFILPSMSAFVGGDITAGILAGRVTEKKEITLLIDLGTNGELVLGNEDKLIACSTAAGPAFEGGANRGVWGSDMVRILATLRRMQIVDETGLLQDAYFERGVSMEGVHVTQQAIRAVQLAKGAIMAGIRILLRQYGIGPAKIDRVILAGGFGYYLSPQDAVAIGLLPTELRNKVVTGGNTALTGAYLFDAERNGSHAKPFFWEVNRTKKFFLNLAEVPGFEKLFYSSMDLTELSE